MIRVAILLLASFQLPAQPPAFDVASVKASQVTSARDRIIRINPGRFSARGYGLLPLIAKAYGVPTFLISGGPGWINSEFFDIEAKTDTPVEEAQVKLMLQALLADRFQLKLHRETKSLPVSSLTLGKRSAKLTTSKEDGVPRFSWTPFWVMGRNMSMSDLATLLTGQLGQLVIDKTGLEGEFDFRVDNSPGGDPWTRASEAATILPGELGLKMESQKGPVETLVIDHSEKPSEN